MITNEIRPHKCYAHHRDESFDSVDFPHVRILDVESRRFHGFKKCLNLPSVLVCRNGIFRSVEADEDLKFRLPVGVFESRSGKVNIFTFHEIELVIEKFLTQSDPVKEMPCPHFLPGFGIHNPKILADSYVVAYPVVIEPLNPFLSNKLPVCYETINAIMAKKIYEPLYEGLALLPVGVAPFREKFEKQRECDASVCYAQHKNIDVGLTKLPVGSVHGKGYSAIGRKKTENHSCYQVKTQSVFGKEPLEPSHVRIPFHAGRHGCGQLVEADCLNNAKRMDYIRHQLYADKIHIFPKMFLHNREDLVNFAQVLGFGNFHMKKRLNFSLKLLNFRDFCKFYRLKFRCLTA